MYMKKYAKNEPNRLAFKYINIFINVQYYILYIDILYILLCFKYM